MSKSGTVAPACVTRGNCNLKTVNCGGVRFGVVAVISIFVICNLKFNFAKR